MLAAAGTPNLWNQFLTASVAGLVTAALYAIAASGLVVTYTTSGVFNFAHGAFGMMAAFTYWQFTEGWGLPIWLSLLLVVGVLSAVALALYMAASQLLPMGLFGLLTYVEPVLLVVVALLLGERLAPGQWLMYGLVFAAVGVLVVDALRQILRAPPAIKNMKKTDATADAY